MYCIYMFMSTMADEPKALRRACLPTELALVKVLLEGIDRLITSNVRDTERVGPR